MDDQGFGPRRRSVAVEVGGVIVGGGHPVVVQSMTNTATSDVAATVAQIERLERAGCEIVRVAGPDDAAAAALSEIKRRIKVPLIADIHFRHDLALAALDAGVDCLRINPGNIGSVEKVAKVVEGAKARGVPIRIGVYPTVFLRDVATVVDGSDIVTSYALVNGRRTVYIPVTKRADASTLSVVALVKQNLARFQSVLPSDVKVSYEFDQSPYVTRAIGGLTLEGVLGAGLTGLMVLLFLRDWRSSFIVVINIPLSLLSAVLALWITGQTVNIMTLGGLALAVGILVDEATVCIENIHVHLAHGKSLNRAALDATTETIGPRLLAMLCILAMFIPALFMVGAARAMFIPLALAVGFSMVASYLLSGTLVPILSVWLLRGHERSVGQSAPTQTPFAAFQGGYAGVMRRVMAWRALVVAAYFVLSVLVILVVGRRLGSEIFPRIETGQFQVRLRAPAGTQIDGTERYALQALDLVKNEVGASNVEITLGFLGVHGANYPINLVYLWNGGPEEGVLQVQLKKDMAIRIEELKERLSYFRTGHNDGDKLSAKAPARQCCNRTARSVWSAGSLLPLLDVRHLRSKAPASWTHSKRFAW